MAEENARLPREPAPGFVGRLVPDPASPPELTLLVGYPGASTEKESIRLYASPELSRWWEIPEEEILHRQMVPNDPLGAEIVWVRRDKQPVLNPRRSEPDMLTTTIPSHNLVCPSLPVHCLPPTTPVGAQAGGQQLFTTQPFTQFHFCTTTTTSPVGAGPAVQTPVSQHCTLLLCTPPATTFPTFNLCTLPPSVGCQNPAQTGAQAQAFNLTIGPVHPPTSFDRGCTTSPVGAGAVNTIQTPPTPGGTYGGAVHSWVQCLRPPTLDCVTPACTPPQTNLTYVPHPHEMQTWVPPQTQGCGTAQAGQGFYTTTIPSRDIHCFPTTPVTQHCAYGGPQGYPNTVVRTHDQPCGTVAWPRTQDVYCGTSPVAQGAQAIPSITYPTIPPYTICCGR